MDAGAYAHLNEYYDGLNCVYQNGKGIKKGKYCSIREAVFNKK